MNRKLYLIRHSYAESNHQIKDFDRSLTATGEKYARGLADYFRSSNFDPDLVLCSPANRTQQTLSLLAESLGLGSHLIQEEKSIYEASVRELLKLVNETSNEVVDLAIVGHNPAITYFAEFLTGAPIANVDPSGVVTVSFKEIPWAEITQRSGEFMEYYHADHV